MTVSTPLFYIIPDFKITICLLLDIEKIPANLGQMIILCKQFFTELLKQDMSKECKIFVINIFHILNDVLKHSFLVLYGCFVSSNNKEATFINSLLT